MLTFDENQMNSFPQAIELAASSQIPCHPEQIEERNMNASDSIVYACGAFLGISAGLLNVKFGDLLLNALFVLASTMLLGALRPEKPWRWTLVVAIFVPTVQLLAFLFVHEKPYRAQVYESFLGFLTGIAGAYGGSFGRKGWKELFGK